MPAGRSLIALPAPPAQRVVRALTRRRTPWHARLGPSERRTIGIGIVAAGTTIALVAGEVGRVWWQGSAAAPGHGEPVLQAAEVAVGETVAAARAGYEEAPDRANALFNLLASFVTTFAAARAITYLLRGGRRVGPFRDVHIARRHIHHFVPGILLALLSGGASIAVRREHLDTWLALPFGTGAALILDETALLIELNDVYWSDEGVLSIDVGLGATGLLASLALITRLLRRGERVVLDQPSAPVS